MAEIKSTIDLIMERTKNLSLSEEEKTAIRRREAEGKVKGWIQRYRDGLATLRDLKKEFTEEKKTFPDAEQIFRSALLEHVEPAGENGAVFELMEKVLKMKTEPVRELALACREELSRIVLEGLEAEREALRRKGVSGAAVIPNPNRDRALMERLRGGRAAFQERLRERLAA
ncbi:MAG: hypothetical protein HPY65_17845 [Syntrophaceae bacterium]|nr:hypothetical protein [Syntrophaceae bacterium]